MEPKSLNRDELMQLKETINRLSEEQDRIYNEFLVKNNLIEEKNIEPFIFDFVYNGYDIAHIDKYFNINK